MKMMKIISIYFLGMIVCWNVYQPFAQAQTTELKITLNMNREQAITFLQSKPPGTYLIRESSQTSISGHLALSIVDNNNEIKHYLVKLNEDRTKISLNDGPFKNIETLFSIRTEPVVSPFKVHGFDRERSEEILKDKSRGTYLLRVNTRPGKDTFSYVSPSGEIKHSLIILNHAEGKLSFDDGRTYGELKQFLKLFRLDHPQEWIDSEPRAIHGCSDIEEVQVPQLLLDPEYDLEKMDPLHRYGTDLYLAYQQWGQELGMSLIQLEQSEAKAQFLRDLATNTNMNPLMQTLSEMQTGVQYLNEEERRQYEIEMGPRGPRMANSKISLDDGEYMYVQGSIFSRSYSGSSKS